MTPAMGLMKLIEMGMEKGGIRDSMATRQIQRGGQALQMADQPLMSPVDTGGPFSQPAPQMSPAMPQLVDASPDTFDQIMRVVGAIGGNNMQGGSQGRMELLGGSVPNMGMTAQDMMSQNQGGGLMTILKLMAAGA
jgi:hypothetical protein